MPSSLARALSRVLAVLAPLAVLGGALGWWARPDPGEAEEAPAVTTCRAQLARDGAEDVVFGNSKAQSDLDVAALRRGLGTDRVARLNVNGTRAPVWYATMARCLAAADARPRLVIVYGTLGSIVRVTLETELE